MQPRREGGGATAGEGGGGGASFAGLTPEERRALAIEKLSRLFGTAAARQQTPAEAERCALLEILKASASGDAAAAARLARDRLSALSTAEESSSSDDEEQGSRGDESRNGDARRRARAAAEASAPLAAARPAAASTSGRCAPVSTVTAQLRSLVQGRAEPSPELLDPGYWASIVRRRPSGSGPSTAAVSLDCPAALPASSVHPPSPASPPPPPPLPPREAFLQAGSAARARVLDRGFAACETHHPQDSPDQKGRWALALARAVDALLDAGWPPVFVYMLDATWDALDSLYDFAGAALEGEALLEPSFFAWAVMPPQARGEKSVGPVKAVRAIGTNFGLPHRDYSYAESWAEAPEASGQEGAPMMSTGGLTPTLVSVWLALTDCTLDNGCMVVLPREHDPLFARSDHDDHLRVATEGARGVTECRFNLAAGRPLPVRAGSVLSWAGNTVHWGSACNAAGTADPRRSMAVTFRRRDLASGGGCEPSVAAADQPHRASADAGSRGGTAAAAGGSSSPAWLRGGLLSREQARALTLEERLKLVAQALLLYGRWYSMPAALPLPLVVTLPQQ